MNSGLSRNSRIAGAVLTMLGGSVHLQQWWRVFRHLDIGPLFLLNAATSIVIAALVLAWDDPLPLIGGFLFAAGSLLALLASRTIGLLGFEAVGYDTPEIEAIVIEILAMVTLGGAWWSSRPTARRSSRPVD